MDYALILLVDKRTTLEDKIIVRNFAQLQDEYKRLHEGFVVVSQQPAVALQDELLQELKEINLLIAAQLEDFLGAIRYNLNFFEQYYEYDFAASLGQTRLQVRLHKVNCCLHRLLGCRRD